MAKEPICRKGGKGNPSRVLKTDSLSPDVLPSNELNGRC